MNFIPPATRARKAISKSLRFKVLARDGFKCTYCGAAPPAVVLHLDHREPHSKGGADTEDNLVTACLPCNLGKGAHQLSASRSRIIQGAGAVMRRPKVEIFWKWDRAKGRRLDAARCVEFLDGAEVYGGEEYSWYSRNYDYSSHGHSCRGFSPYEAAMYVIEMMTAEWRSFARYVAFVDDVNLAASKGQLPLYIAPVVLRGLHPQTLFARCVERPAEYAAIGDSVADQSMAVFGDFIASQHTPWADVQ